MELIPYDTKLKLLSQKLRREQTKAEKFLWSFLRRKQLDGFQWYRQKPLGNYIVDFYCPKRKLVVEADGAYHFFKDGKEYDAGRDASLKELGLKILRFSNVDILGNIEKVLKAIREFK